MIQHNIDNFTKIAIWGLPGSGKTSYCEALPEAIRSFPHTYLSLIADEINKDNVFFDSATETYQYYLRVERKLKETYAKDFDPLNNQLHKFAIFDPQDKAVINTNNQHYKNADMVILILDPIMIDNPALCMQYQSPRENEVNLDYVINQSVFFRNDQKKNHQKRNKIIQSDFFYELNKFINTLGKNKPMCCICVSKFDLLEPEFYKMEIERVIEIIFGTQTAKLIVNNFKGRIFPISINRSNIPQGSERNLIKRYPFNVEKPVIALITEVEKQRLSKKKDIKIIPYYQEGNK